SRSHLNHRIQTKMFSINDSPDHSYYPLPEGSVIALREIVDLFQEQESPFSQSTTLNELERDRLNQKLKNINSNSNSNSNLDGVFVFDVQQLDLNLVSHDEARIFVDIGDIPFREHAHRHFILISGRY